LDHHITGHQIVKATLNSMASRCCIYYHWSVNNSFIIYCIDLLLLCTSLYGC